MGVSLERGALCRGNYCGNGRGQSRLFLQKNCLIVGYNAHMRHCIKSLSRHAFINSQKRWSDITSLSSTIHHTHCMVIAGLKIRND